MKKRSKKNAFQKKRKWLVSLLTLCLMMMAMPDTVWAKTDGNGLCPHHTEHTEDCGYVEGSCTYVCEICQQEGKDTPPDPEEIIEETPEEIAEENPEENVEEAPDENPEEDPEEDPDKIPEENEEALTESGSIVLLQDVARAAGEYQIWVGGVQVTSDNAGNVLAGGNNDGKVSYDPDTNTLTLNGANISYDSKGKGSLRSEEDGLTVELLGTNTIKDETTEVNTIYPLNSVFSKGNLTFCGDGSLEVTTQSEAETTDSGIECIRCEGNFTLRDATVKVTAGNITGDHGGSDAIYVSGKTCIDGGKLTAISGTSAAPAWSTAINAYGDIEIINGAEVTAQSGQGGLRSVGISADKNVTIQDSTVSCTSGEGKIHYGNSGGISTACSVDAKLTISNSVVIAVSADTAAESFAIESSGLEVYDSRVKATAGAGKGGRSAGLYVNNDDNKIILRDSEITAEAGQSDYMSAGIQCFGEMEVNEGSNVTAVGGTVTNLNPEYEQFGSYGLFSYGNIRLNGGEITAVSGGGPRSWGAYCMALEVNGGSMTATGGNADLESYGLYLLSFDFPDDEDVGEDVDFDAEGMSKLTLTGGSVRAKAGNAADSSVGMNMRNSEISGGTLVAIAGQASEKKAITTAPNIAEDYKVTVKAGDSEATAAVVEFPTDDEYWYRTYVSIEPGEDDGKDDKPGGDDGKDDKPGGDDGNNNKPGGDGGNDNKPGENGDGGDGTGSNDGGSDESSAAGGNSSNLSDNRNGSANTGSVPAGNVSAAGGNKKDDVPKTGDDASGSWIWLWLVLAASVAGAGIFLTGKREVIIKKITAGRNEAKEQG